jgi:hypothetical protein
MTLGRSNTVELAMSSSPLRNPTVLASLLELAEPIAVIPPPDERGRLRTAAGVPPQTAAAVLGVGFNTFIGRWEKADVAGATERIKTFGNSDGYARLLRVFQAYADSHAESEEENAD